MKLLAIDTAASVLSAALANEEEIFSAETEAVTRHSELVMELIDSLFKKAGILPKDINGILCMGGPGSFTGLRIGYSIAKGLALSLSIPFAPVPTLDCIANNEKYSHGLTLAVIEARKNASFYAFFKDGKRLTEDKDSNFLQIANEIELYKNAHKQITLTGPGSKLLYESLCENTRNNVSLVFKKNGYAKELIAIAKSKKLFNNDCTAYLYSGPEYIRKTDAEIALRQITNKK
jgi:tRNA threonylcarbamoyladenosine biosynthesis protein TsaB